MQKKYIKNTLGFDTNLFVYQDKQMFNYSVDTVLLANFISLSSKTKKVLEIGTNNAALSIFLASRKEDMNIDAIEIQSEAIDLALLNVKENHLEKQINIIHADFNEYWKTFDKIENNKYDAIICNPPFYKQDKIIPSTKKPLKTLALYEIALNFEQIMQGCAKIIKQKANLAMVIPTTRLVDLLEMMRKYQFEPKRIKMIYPRIYEQSNLVLVEARYKTGWGTHFEPNLYLHYEDKQNHEYTKEVLKWYKPIKFKKSNEGEAK
ncbi:tRNA1(Val) (adenine(37)-N6)-methyltransferase [Ureaplasma urealyticum]|uniref:tRNA1(Val) (Adenine(37)-N6)-methyltransferase n=3 Tax=Ureaplasma urealyticum TaxID=2130 RepID=A0AAP9D7L4_UREUR|nr:tRNA1(Val) (adenine(37)-N6)-methyltransferase [Ureaplasma urealyticum]EDX53944.1 DNA methylase [Ureaplasma urealyticum serovar 9 str. ATCC 33175]ACI60102.1 DNA methylase [Ureaplasma urealyticum serovar 10 str. ATCC 33699]EDT49311.1 DNA methylase [Ureaplasma urealyticum serovar 13 str. ATCC 33698]EDU05945.1 DNA methylase [Ureaplasma urealyticum serovar 5 str. ATCC 27817]EDU56990.1 DNA methylase [Ureaplasma urealyticum serovar 7 str. ATCC 27819]